MLMTVTIIIPKICLRIVAPICAPKTKPKSSYAVIVSVENESKQFYISVQRPRQQLTYQTHKAPEQLVR